MSIRIELAESMEVLSLRVVGPYYEKIPQGFDEILSWAREHHLSIDKSLAFYWDDPSKVEADELRADVAITCKEMPSTLPEDVGIRREVIPGGLYAVTHTIVENGDFAKAWDDFYKAINAQGYCPAGDICYESYLCDGSNGKWDIEIWQSVEAAN
ncbi:MULTISPECIES: GyrI-like domain-containing protein [Pectobacterium]|uniref:DNA gyrase inhibitor n=1 Tax=Pectobacterium carotovorum subsp. carotovorum (strain PC1) TaxID=561230 RepID=SBMC_PECCP|nr:GyrI-like domain-containing protein [Pectobacterium carotovorum]C6DEF0.1 RecName: Full=DNA gyrase inhibitor [Pectobacterium carotovorum subsp. carotovorum PC1]ACT12635.1 transcription activator effector binding [Pectobacterium carotovorum subsp. carotovorum PC1]